MSVVNVRIESLPLPLLKAFSASTDARISQTEYVNHLKDCHCFTKEVDPTGNDYTKRLYKESLEDVLSTVPEMYRDDFNRGYHWNCELCKKIRENTSIEVNWKEETNNTEEVERKEGKKKGYYTTKYERNPKNREEAIRIHGTKCMICGFDFGKMYGELGKDYIEVHHIVPLSKQDEEVVIDPAKDLVCVCANCHRMLHRFRDYIVGVEELRQIIEDNN